MESTRQEDSTFKENESEELIVDAILVIPPSNSSLVVPRNITETEEAISNEPVQLQQVRMQQIETLQQEMAEMQQNQLHFENLELEREQWALLGHEPIKASEHHCSVDIPLQDDWICDNTQACYRHSVSKLTTSRTLKWSNTLVNLLFWHFQGFFRTCKKNYES